MSRETARYTYTEGSSQGSAIVYDDDTKIHNHSDTNPARGQCSAFDLVRSHKFSALDKGIPADTLLTERPSFKAMIEFAEQLPEIRTMRAQSELVDLGPPPAPANEAPSAHPFAVLEAADFASAEDSEPDWQVRGLIPRQGTGLHPGPSGTLKSFAELDLACAIHRGVEYHGRPVTKGRAVIVVAEGARGYKRRLRAYAKHHGVNLADLPAVIPAAPNLYKPKQIDALIQQLRLKGVQYLVLDTKWRCSVEADENSASDQAVVLGSMDRIARELNCFVMAVTHTGRDVSKGARGSSAQYAAVDVELTQERSGDYCTVRVTKAKDAESDIELTSKIVVVDLGRNKHGEPESSLVLQPADPAEAAVKFVPKGDVERAVYDYVRASGKTEFAKEALTAAVAERRKCRPATIRRTIERQLDGRLFRISGDELTLLPRLAIGTDEEWPA